MDGEPELGTAWSCYAAVAEYFEAEAAGFDPATATVRIRATNAAGIVGDWSAPSPFEVAKISLGHACSAAPGSSGSSGTLVALLALALGLVIRRRPAQ